MVLWKWLLIVWRWFVTVLHPFAKNKIIPTSTSKTSCESDWKKLRREIDNLGAFDLHNILRRQNRIEWCEWHLNIDENDNAIKIAEQFHQYFKKLKSSSSIVDQIDTIKETFLEFKLDDSVWLGIRAYFEQAREQNNPEWIIKAYTSHQCFTEHLNKHSAANTYHALKLYCTLLNCPILAETQEYTEAFTRILFHPKLEKFLVRERTVYRGLVLQDKKLVENYKEGATIITTTFLSTSTDPGVADIFLATATENEISVRCIYNINNTNRHTALDVTNQSVYPGEKEILILRYVPFTIKSVERTDDGRRMTICFDECKEHCTVEENRV